jgi:hypothetical protein
MLHAPSVRSTASTLTSRLSTSFPFHKLASNPFSRSKSRLGLTVNTDVVPSTSIPSISAPCYSPHTPQTPPPFFSPTSTKDSKYPDFPSLVSYDKLAENLVSVDRVLTPEADPFAKIDGYYAYHLDRGCSNDRSKTPTIRSTTNADSWLADYSFPSTSVSPFSHPITSELESARASYTRSSSPQSPTHARPLPKFPSDTKPLLRRPKHTNDNRLPDWTLCLPNSSASHTRRQRQHSDVDLLKPANERVRFSSTPARPGSPFPFIGELSARIETPHNLEPSLSTVSRRSESASRASSSDLQMDQEWPLPPRRTVVVVIDSDSEDDLESVGNTSSTEKGRSLRQGWHDVEPSVEVFTPPVQLISTLLTIIIVLQPKNIYRSPDSPSLGSFP